MQLSTDIRERLGLPDSGIPHVREHCIPYIKSCGFKLVTCNPPWYIFKRKADGKEVAFTLSEIRDAYKNGW